MLLPLTSMSNAQAVYKDYRLNTNLETRLAGRTLDVQATRFTHQTIKGKVILTVCFNISSSLNLVSWLLHSTELLTLLSVLL